MFIFIECNLDKLVCDEEALAQKISVEEQKLDKITKQYEKLKTLLQQKQQSRKSDSDLWKPYTMSVRKTIYI